MFRIVWGDCCPSFVPEMEGGISFVCLGVILQYLELTNG
jgi:hypothetical protein